MDELGRRMEGKKMKVRIGLDFRQGSWGGGNQFLKALYEALKSADALVETKGQEEVLIVNSHHWGPELPTLLKRSLTGSLPLVIHRVDGPLALVRGRRRELLTDFRINAFSRLVASGTIFQSNWSQKQCLRLGMRARHFRIIGNAPDPRVFSHGKRVDNSAVTHRIVSASWSANEKKGFRYLELLDSREPDIAATVLHVGNSPRKFKNIALLPPVSSPELATILSSSKIFLTASQDDPCSNALIEAIHSGCAPVALKSGGHPEIVQNPELTFSSYEEMVEILKFDDVKLEKLRRQIKLASIDEACEQYLDFAKDLFEKRDRRLKPLGIWMFFVLDTALGTLYKIMTRIGRG